MKQLVALVFAFGLLAGCTSSGGDSAPDLFASDYTIAAGDKIKVTVEGEKDLSGQHTVDSAGTILVPIAGPVTVTGLSLGDAAAAYAAKLRDGQILRSPKVKIEAVGMRPILVLGEVKRPGEYAYASGLTVRDAIELAQGYSYYARESIAELTRRGRTVEIEMETEIKILPGDTVRVPRRLF